MSKSLRRIESNDQVKAEEQSVDIGDQTKFVDAEGNIDDSQEGENMFPVVPHKRSLEPLPVKQKKDEQMKGIVEPQKEIQSSFDTSPVTAYEISELLKPSLDWPISGKNFVNSQHGKLYFREHMHVGFDNFDLYQGISCCSCVQADIKWANRLLKQVGASRTDQNIIALDLKSTQPEVFESLLAKGSAGVSVLKDFMNELSQTNILCAATALALTILLRSKDDVLFSRLVGYSSSVVIQQIMSYQRGALITIEMINIALKYVTEYLTTESPQLPNETTLEWQLSNLAKNLVSTFIKHHARQGEKPLKKEINSLISEIKDSFNGDFDIKRAGILTGIIFSGAITRAIEIAKNEKKRHENVKAVIGITLSVVGGCGIVGADKVTDLVAIIVNIFIEKSWKLNYKDLPSDIKRFVNQSIYGPLEIKNVMPFSSSNSRDKLTYEQREDFKGSFEYVMRMNDLL